MSNANVLLLFLDRSKLIIFLQGRIEELKSGLGRHLQLDLQPVTLDDHHDDVSGSVIESNNATAWQTLADDVISYLDALSKISGIQHTCNDDDVEFRQVLRNLEDILLPLLFYADGEVSKNAHHDDDVQDVSMITTSSSRAFKTSCDLVVCTLKLCKHIKNDDDDMILRQILQSVLRFCLLSKTKLVSSSSSSMDNSVELLCRVFGFLCDDQQLLDSDLKIRVGDRLLDKEMLEAIRNNLMEYLRVCSPRTCVRITIELLPRLVKLDQGLELASRVWNVVLGSFQFADDDDDIRESNPNGFLLLGCTADLVFTVIDDASTSLSFWRIVQHGLTSADSLRRKQSLYLVKRALDCVQLSGVDATCERFSCERFVTTTTTSSAAAVVERARKCFEDILFVLETLEEKQVHVIKPMFPVVKRLINATEKDDDKESSWSLHTSWIVVVLRRMLVLESKTIKLWLIEVICSMDLTKVPIFNQGMRNFLQFHFLMSLNDATIFTGIGRIHEFGFTDLLALHLRHCIKSLKTEGAQAKYFRQLLHKIQSSVWSAVPLFYVVKTLSAVEMKPHWSLDSLNDLRELVVNTVRTHDTFIRVATEEFLLVAFLRFADQTVLTLNELGSILAIFKDLRRGTALWTRVVGWTKQAEFAQLTLAVEFLAEATSSMLTLSETDDDDDDRDSRIPAVKDSFEMQKVARMAVLLADVHVDAKIEKVFKLQPFVDILTTAHSRSYMLEAKPEAAMKFLLAIIDELKQKNDTHCPFECHVRWHIATCADDFMNYFRRRIFQDSHQLADYENLETHFKFVRLLIENEEFLIETHQIVDLSRTTLRQHLNALALKCVSNLDQLNDDAGNYMDKIVIVKCLALVCRDLSRNECSSREDRLHILSLMDQLATGNRLCSAPRTAEPVIFADWTHTTNPNQIASDYVQCIWSCVLHLQLVIAKDKNSCNHSNAPSILSKGIEALQIGGVKSLAIIFRCFELLLPAQTLEAHSEFIEQILDNCWRALIENKPSISFWAALTAFVDMAFQPSLMSDENLSQCLSNYGSLIYEKSQTYHGMYLPLVKRVVSIWKVNSAAPVAVFHGELHGHILVQGLLFGHIHRKDHKVVKDTEAYIVSLGTLISANTFMESDYLHDKMVRVHSVLSLVMIRHDVAVVQAFVQRLIGTNSKITSSKPRHYANSMVHRVKERIWQSLLILEPSYTQELGLNVFAKIIEVLIDDNLQPSVRYLVEWLAVRICLRFTSVWKHLWAAMDTAGSTRVGSLSSFVTIVCHVGCANVQALQCHLENNAEDNIDASRVEFISKAIVLIASHISTQHFNTRIYAQVTLKKLWSCCKSCNSRQLEKLIEMYRPIESLFNVPTEHRVSARSAQKLSDYYFQVFDVEKHFSLETIFYEFPRLCNVLEDELLENKLFSNALESYKESTNSSLSVALSNKDRSLATLQTGSWIIRSSGESANDTDSVAESDVSVSSRSGDIGGGDLQRKLTPWKQEIVANYEAICAASGSSVYNRAERNLVMDHDDEEHLVVVASLIDKATNLGGLCRTCEVFGANRYVIGSLRYVEDKIFQSLSVSSEKWVPIEEVKVHNLKDYLINMKAEGYTVVGIEQTANSVSLNKFRFPKKAVLVLGKEKEGIPVEIIQLMDACVEIPQQGIVRSLNVHVTGAILIWEYRRQRSELKELKEAAK